MNTQVSHRAGRAGADPRPRGSGPPRGQPGGPPRAPLRVQRGEALVDSEDGGRGLVRAGTVFVGLPFEQVWGRTQACGAAGAPPAPVCFNGSPYQPVPVAAGVDPTGRSPCSSGPMTSPASTSWPSPVREYPAAFQAGAAHVLGVPRPSQPAGRHGRQGPRGRHRHGGALRSGGGVRPGPPRRHPAAPTVAIDPRGVVTGTLSKQPIMPGRDVVTRLDLRVQSAAERGAR